MLLASVGACHLVYPSTIAELRRESSRLRNLQRWLLSEIGIHLQKMLQQPHRRHCCSDRLRVGAISSSDIGSVVPAFSGAGTWNGESVCRAPDAIHSNAIRQGCYRDMADCDTGTMGWLSQPCPTMSNKVNDHFVRQEMKKTHDSFVVYSIFSSFREGTD